MPDLSTWQGLVQLIPRFRAGTKQDKAWKLTEMISFKPKLDTTPEYLVHKYGRSSERYMPPNPVSD